MDSNPICYSPAAVAYSSCSDSPTMDFPVLQANANMAVNWMLLIKRSSDFDRQWAIWDFEALLKQQEAAANERARIVHSRSDLSAKVKCAKVVMKVKYEYWVVVQEARATQCSELEESEGAYSEAICKNVAAKSLKYMADHSDHARLMHKLERWALDAENKSCQDFLLTHQTTLSHAPQSLKEDLHSSYQILLGQSSSWQCILPARVPQTDGQPPTITSPKQEPKWSPLPKRQHSSTEAQGDTSADEDSPVASQEGPSSSKIGEDGQLVLLPESQLCGCLLLGLQSHERGHGTLFHHSPLGLGSQQHG